MNNINNGLPILLLSLLLNILLLLKPNWDDDILFPLLLKWFWVLLICEVEYCELLLVRLVLTFGFFSTMDGILNGLLSLEYIYYIKIKIILLNYYKIIL